MTAPDTLTTDITIHVATSLRWDGDRSAYLTEWTDTGSDLVQASASRWCPDEDAARRWLAREIADLAAEQLAHAHRAATRAATRATTRATADGQGSAPDDGVGLACAECGEPMTLTDTEIAHHLTADGGIDHDADADHVALDDTQIPHWA